MGIIVQKFGGSSVKDTERLFNVCKRVINEYNKGNKVVVVLSAQGKTTNGLIAEAEEISNDIDKRELDVLLSTGEQKSISKLCMCLHKEGYKAISLTGWQIPIITESENGNAKIKHIYTDRINFELNNGNIVVIAGFQGIDENGNITTLGRGGSDTTAVAIASVLDAERCDIYTDVDGVYSSDPNIVEDVKKIERVSYDEMLELASMGAKVLHNRCVEIGEKFKMPIFVKSSLQEKSDGTLVTNDTNIEDTTIRGVAKDEDISMISVLDVKDDINNIYKIFKLISDSNISVDIISKSVYQSINNILFTVSKKDSATTFKLLNENIQSFGAKGIEANDSLSKISIVRCWYGK